MQATRNKYISISALISIVIVFSLGCSNVVPELPLPAAQAAPAAPAQKLIYSKNTPIQPIKPAPAAPAKPAEIPTSTAVGKEHNSQIKTTSKPKNKLKTVDSPRSASFPVTIMDREGYEVIFEEAPNRIVAFDSAAVETIFAIGEGHRIIATHDFVSYPPQVNSIKKVGDAFNMDIEAIVNLNPDLVYIFYPTFKEQLENAGLRVLLIQTIDDDFQKTADLFRMWGSITGAVAEADILASDFEMRIDSIQNMLSPYKSGP